MAVRKPKPKNSIVAALDIGSSKMACFIGRVIDDEGGLEVIGIGHNSAKGVKAGIITDIAAAEESIRQAIHAAETMAAAEIRGYPLRDIVVNVPSTYTRTQHAVVDVQTLGHEVTDQDIRKAVLKAQKLERPEGHALVHTISAGYSIDGHRGIDEPRGLHGQVLKVDVNVVTAESAALKNIAHCIERSHLEIQGLCVGPYGAGLAALVQDELDLGCTVIDMGGGVTSYAVFREGAMIHAGAVPVGGAHVTGDIAHGLGASVAEAERIKILYGSALASAADTGEMIDIPQVGEEDDDGVAHVPRSQLVGIMQPRLEEIFELVRNKLDASGYAEAAGRRVTLTGGACQTPGMRDLANMILNRQTRIGRPIRLKGLPEATSGPAFAATAGLLHYIVERQDEQPRSPRRVEMMQGSLPERVLRWLKENW